MKVTFAKYECAWREPESNISTRSEAYPRKPATARIENPQDHKGTLGEGPPTLLRELTVDVFNEIEKKK